MRQCKYCKEEVYGETHHCNYTGEYYDIQEDGSSFLISAAIGWATDSAILGGLLGGDIVGGILGDALDGDLWD